MSLPELLISIFSGKHIRLVISFETLNFVSVLPSSAIASKGSVR